MSMGTTRRRITRRLIATTAVGAGAALLLTGCFAIGGGDSGPQRKASSRHSSASGTASGAASGAASAPATDGSGASSPLPGSGASADAGSPGAAGPSDPAQSHLATAAPTEAALPDPVLIPVPKGTVVAEGDVASPKGSIHFHYRMVSDGDNTYSAQYTSVRSTLPVPVSVTLLDVAPRIGDGLTYHGISDHSMGGADPAPASTASLEVGHPAYLGTLVTYSAADPEAAVPTEIGRDKVLIVTPLRWHVPVRKSTVHPVDHGARQYASGFLTAKTASGAPKRYRVGGGDTTAVVAERFGISVKDLLWLNHGLEVFDARQYLYEDTDINLDPDSL